MDYDPRSNPRWRGDEVEETPDVDRELLASRLPLLNAACETLDSRGWEVITQALERTLDHLKRRALSSKTIEELAEARGKIRAYEEFLSLPSSLKIQREQSFEAVREMTGSG